MATKLNDVQIEILQGYAAIGVGDFRTLTQVVKGLSFDDWTKYSNAALKLTKHEPALLVKRKGTKLYTLTVEGKEWIDNFNTPLSEILASSGEDDATEPTPAPEATPDDVTIMRYVIEEKDVRIADLEAALTAAHAQYNKLAGDFMTQAQAAAADYARLATAARSLLRALDNLFTPARLDRYPEGTQEYAADRERLALVAALKGEG